TLVIMDCQFDIKKVVIGPKDLHTELKDENVEQRRSIDLKCETFSTFDTVSSQDAELENLQMKIKIDYDQLRSVYIRSETHSATDLLSFEDTIFE
ncbi:hypothetical protein L9F63_020213, partial [Diploptera punctata]